MANIRLDGTLKINGIDYNFPAADGAATQTLATDGSGNLSWAAPTGLSGLTTGTLPKAAAGNTLANSNIAVSGTVVTITGTLVISGNVLTIRGVAYTFPAADGTTGQKLTTNGSGVLSWS